jgi:N-acetylglucosaminyl-diphospho-decaprenol L-rhamnosyltransferase
VAGPGSPTLGVVIPHHSRGDLLPAALEAVRGHPVFLVDDSPEGLDPGTLPAGVTPLRAAGGGGFAQACNLGLAAVEAAGLSWALLLNDDARPAPGCLEALLAAAAANPHAAALGPLLLDPAGGIESAGIRVRRLSARVRQLRSLPAGIRAVDALSGACLLLEPQLRLDPSFPFGFEDIELCLRLRRGGREVLLVPEARCHHLGGATVPRDSRRATRHALAGHLRLVREHPWQRPLVLGWALAQVIREGGPAARIAGLWEGWRDSRGF